MKIRDTARTQGYTVMGRLPSAVRIRLVAASQVDWPRRARGESHERNVAIDEAITFARDAAPACFKPL